MSSGQYFQLQTGDVLEMTPAQTGSLKNEFERMYQEMDTEHSIDKEEQNAEDEILAAAMLQSSLSASFNHLTMEENSLSPSPRSALIHELSSNSAKLTDESPTHIIITGDYTEVDKKVYSLDFNSHRVANNIIENSFGVEGKVCGENT